MIIYRDRYTYSRTFNESSGVRRGARSGRRRGGQTSERQPTSQNRDNNIGPSGFGR